MLEQETVDACTSLRVLYKFRKDSAEKQWAGAHSRELVWEFSTGLHRQPQSRGLVRTLEPQDVIENPKHQE